MFARKPKIVEKPKGPSREEQLGPKPVDIPNTDPLLTFQILLRHSLPSIEVQAHTHDFGEETGCDKPRTGRFTHFYVKGDTTWVEYEKYIGLDDMSRSVHRWVWVKRQPARTVFSIRTEDVVMVVASDNVNPVESETLALELRAKPEPEPRKPGGPVMSAPAYQFTHIDPEGIEYP